MSSDPALSERAPMLDLAPEIFRQRLVIEGLVDEPITADQITRYLSGLSDVCGMIQLLDPVTHQSDRYGWAGWIHWETSGAHFYGWDEPVLFFSVDVYTCKAFDVDAAVQYTGTFFNATRVEHREF